MFLMTNDLQFIYEYLLILSKAKLQKQKAPNKIEGFKQEIITKNQSVYPTSSKALKQLLLTLSSFCSRH